ncbi:MAG: potassium-transporting ATPase subunit KdpA [Rhodospirillaceae bacterium]
MTANGWAQILVFLGAVLLVTKPVGLYLARVFDHRRTWLDPVARPVERLVYRLARVDETREMRWTEYGAAMLLFSAVSFAALYATLRLQAWQPWGNPQAMGPVPPYLAFNTAVSFTTNTNWQAYTGERTVSYLTQMAGLAFQHFVSAAAGIALAVAFVRGLARRESATLGNFWVDLTRAWLWVLLPISLVGALVLVSQGVVQNLRPYDRAFLVDPQTVPATDAGGRTTVRTVVGQVIAQGPVASQEIIKELGTNGGGFFNANSAHPFENPTPVTNFLELVAIFTIPAGLVYMLGEMTGSRRHGWTVWAAMALLFLAGATAAYWAEARGNPLLAVDQQASALAPGGNMEGKEVRFGIAASALFAAVTTDASCGAVNSMHDSYTPLGGMVALADILVGEVIFGGVGAGLYGMLIFIILAVFIAGLLVGRTPEYLGKKIEAYDVQMSMLAVLIFPLTVLALTAVSAVSPSFGTPGILNRGPHGLTEVLYAFASAAGNNGSAFGGLGADTPWYDTALGLAMLAGRFLFIVPMLAVAGNLAAKKRVPPSPGTFPVTTPLFGVLLVGVVLVVGALTFFPALSLGPVLEHLMMGQGRTF